MGYVAENFMQSIQRKANRSSGIAMSHVLWGLPGLWHEDLKEEMME